MSELSDSGGESGMEVQGYSDCEPMEEEDSGDEAVEEAEEPSTKRQKINDEQSVDQDSEKEVSPAQKHLFVDRDGF